MFRTAFSLISILLITASCQKEKTVTPPLPQTLSLQPGNNQSELNFAGFANGTNISAHEKDIDAVAWTMGGNVFYTRGAFKFDLSTIPSGSTIISAKLSLYSIPDPTDGNLIDANSGSDNSFYIQRITSDWNITQTTWGTQPSTTTDDQIVISHTDLTDFDLIDLDVKSLVSAMLGSNNYGFKMKLKNEIIYNARQFCSSLYTDATKRPKLVVVYQQ
jgi:hypothetical protein